MTMRPADPLTEFRKLVGLKETTDGSARPYSGDLFKQVTANTAFRRVVSTTDRSQLALMNIPPEGEVGEEKHPDVEQTFVFVSGEGSAMLAGKKTAVGPGSVLVVPPKTLHNIANVGDRPLKFFTVYSPPNHPPGTVHKTKADADADEKDKAFQKR